MHPVKAILRRLNGLHFPQEYLCLPKESFSPLLNIYLVDQNRILKDITNTHLFVGYHPLILSFLKNAFFEEKEIIQIGLTPHRLKENENFSKKDALAWLSCRKMETGYREIPYVFFEGFYGYQAFQFPFQRYAQTLYNRWFNKRPGNVFLHKNLYWQVQVAYSSPRIISLITVSDGHAFNLFPTDLHGSLDDQFYIISLRLGGRACAQVDSAGKVLISRMDPTSFEKVYRLGKNHMKELGGFNDFPFSASRSKTLKLPLPLNAVSYHELQMMQYFDHGIHRLFIFKIVTREKLVHGESLAHIHNSYASWRYRIKLPGNYLLR